MQSWYIRAYIHILVIGNVTPLPSDLCPLFFFFLFSRLSLKCQLDSRCLCTGTQGTPPPNIQTLCCGLGSFVGSAMSQKFGASCSRFPATTLQCSISAYPRGWAACAASENPCGSRACMVHRVLIPSVPPHMFVLECTSDPKTRKGRPTEPDSKSNSVDLFLSLLSTSRIHPVPSVVDSVCKIH